MSDGRSRKHQHRSLTVTAIERKKLPKPPKTYEDMLDGDALFLRVYATGKKKWIVQYDVYRQSTETTLEKQPKNDDKKQRTRITIGSYPQLSLAEARKEAERIKELGKQGVNSTEARKKKKIETVQEAEEQVRTFKDVAEEWLEKEIDKSTLIQSTKRLKRRMLEMHVFPIIGDIDYKKLSHKQLYELVLALYDKKQSTYGLKVSFILNQIGEWAKDLGYADSNVAKGLSKKMNKKVMNKGERAAILEPEKIGEFLNKLNVTAKNLSKIYTEAIELIVYLPVRSLELRGAKKDEFDFENNIWTIPAERMKMRVKHTVPLPCKIAEKIQRLIKFNGDTEYVFPTKNLKGEICIIEDHAMNKRLRRMGYTKKEVSIHGFRSTFSTLMARTCLYGQEIIDASLAHAIGNAVSRTYKRTDYPEKRRQCLEDYCYILDELKKGRDFNDIVKELKRQHYERDMK